MLRMASATEAAAVLISSGNTEASSSLPMITSKANRSNQVVGAYDLIFPELHKDIPTREEVEKCVSLAFIMHHSGTQHGGLFSSTGGSTTVLKPIQIPRVTTIDFMMVRAMSMVNAIGYEV